MAAALRQAAVDIERGIPWMVAMTKIGGLMRVTVIRTDGREEDHEIARAGAVDAINELIGADTFDTVDLRDGRVMLVDDNGWETKFIDHGNGYFEVQPIGPRRPINEKATAIYRSVCRPGVTHQIAGDVAIARDEDFA